MDSTGETRSRQRCSRPLRHTPRHDRRAYLGHGRQGIPEKLGQIRFRRLHGNVFLTEDTKNLYAGADLSYNYKDVFYLAANAVYRHWTTDSDGSDVVVSFKPAVEGNLNLKVRPISPLLVGIGYQHISRQGVEGNKADPVSNLYLNGSYELFKGISVYARVNNLLNKDYQYYWGYPSEGLSFLGGVSFLF